MKFSNGSITAAILAATSYLGTATTATKHKKGSKSEGGKFIKLLAVQKGRGCSITEVEVDVYPGYYGHVSRYNPVPGTTGSSSIHTIYRGFYAGFFDVLSA